MNEEQLSNLVNAVALGIGILNLQENRAQSQYNDVHAANDKQAEFLLGEISKMIDEQNKRLENQDEILNKILKYIEGLNGNNR